MTYAELREVRHVNGGPGTSVSLRGVVEADLEVFFQQQLEPEATAMAAFPARGRDAHFAHWNKILGDATIITRTITSGDGVAGNIVSWVQDGHREIGYWMGKGYWGKGIATAALQQFVNIIGERPLGAWVARHNAASIHVLEKSGFAPEGEHEDHLIYRLD